MKIVCNSSVLITLEKADILHILKDLFGEIFIPKAVRKEVFGRRRFPAFIRCIEISEPFALKVLGSNLETRGWIRRNAKRPGFTERTCRFYAY